MGHLTYHIRRSWHNPDLCFLTVYNNDRRLFSFHTKLMFLEMIKNIFQKLIDTESLFNNVFYLTLPIFTFSTKLEYPNNTRGDITTGDFIFKLFPLYFYLYAKSDARHFYNHLNYFFKYHTDDIVIKCAFKDLKLYDAITNNLSES